MYGVQPSECRVCDQSEVESVPPQYTVLPERGGERDNRSALGPSIHGAPLSTNGNEPSRIHFGVLQLTARRPCVGFRRRFRRRRLFLSLSISLSLSHTHTHTGVAALAAAATTLDNQHAAGALPSDRLVQLHVAVKMEWSKAMREVLPIS